MTEFARAIAFADWLRSMLNERDMSVRKLGQVSEINENTIHSWLASPEKDHHRNITATYADRLALALGVMPNEAREAAGLPGIRSSSIYAPGRRAEGGVTAARIVLVPVVGVAPADGLRHAATVGEMIPVPPAIVQLLSNPRSVVVGGESLAGRGIHDGDYLILDTLDDLDPQVQRDGELLVIREGKELTIREWLRVGASVALRLVTPGHAAIELSQVDGEDVEVLGIVRATASWKVF